MVVVVVAVVVVVVLWTSKSGTNVVCFQHFDFVMCFAPQRGAIFQHLKQKVLRTRQFLTLLTSKYASHHNGAQFFNTWDALYISTAACTFSTSQLPKVLQYLRCFLTFWLGNELRATTACPFEHLNFCTFWLPNVLCARPRRAILHLSSPQMAPHPPL